jgi:serine/threonine kinase 38
VLFQGSFPLFWTPVADRISLLFLPCAAFGEVTIVRGREDGKIYAMKKMSKEAMIMKNQIGHVMAEKAALADLSSSSSLAASSARSAGSTGSPSSGSPLTDPLSLGDWIVKLHFSFQDADFLYLVMEPCLGGDLMGLLIKKDVLPEEWIRFYAAEAAMAIGSVHAAGFVHRDIKPDNFLFDHNGHLYLTDLGLCKAVEEDEIDETTIYAATAGTQPGGAAVPSGSEAGAAGVKGGGLSPPVDVHHDRPGGPGPVPAAGHIKDRKLIYSTVGTPDYIVSPQTEHCYSCPIFLL